MLKVEYRGQTGNQLFQYAFARRLAIELGHRLITNPIPGFDGTKELVDGYFNNKDVVRFDFSHLATADFHQFKGKKGIVISGYFENWERCCHSKMKEWLRITPKNIGQTDKDVLIHVRLGPHFPRDNRAIVSNFYDAAIETMDDINEIYLMSDVADSDPYLTRFYTYHKADKRIPCRRVIGNDLDQFRQAMGFNRIIASNSTFAWWFTFLSNATKVICPIERRNTDDGNSISMCRGRDVRVDDPRFTYVYNVPNWGERSKSTVDFRSSSKFSQDPVLIDKSDRVKSILAFHRYSRFLILNV